MLHTPVSRGAGSQARRPPAHTVAQVTEREPAMHVWDPQVPAPLLPWPVQASGEGAPGWGLSSLPVCFSLALIFRTIKITLSFNIQGTKTSII